MKKHTEEAQANASNPMRAYEKSPPRRALLECRATFNGNNFVKLSCGIMQSIAYI